MDVEFYFNGCVSNLLCCLLSFKLFYQSWFKELRYLNPFYRFFSSNFADHLVLMEDDLWSVGIWKTLNWRFEVSLVLEASHSIFLSYSFYLAFVNCEYFLDELTRIMGSSDFRKDLDVLIKLITTDNWKEPLWQYQQKTI